MKSKRSLSFFAAVIVYLLMLSALSIYDLSFSENMTASASDLFVQFGARVGPMPMFLISAWILNCLFLYRDKKSGANMAVFLLCGGAAYILACPDPGRIPDLLLAAACWSGLFFLVRKLPCPEQSERVIRFLRMGLLVIVLGFVIVQICKFTWGRPRYLAIIQEGAEFQEWLKIQGFAVRDDLYRSFPSGHTYCAACSFLTVLIPDLFPECSVKRWELGLGAFCFTMIIALSRIAAGKHFISDVMAGGGIFLVVFGITLAIEWRKLYEPNHR